MTVTAVRIRKEARALLWPWCAVILAGALPGLVVNSYTIKLNLLGFFVGVPLLAALSVGIEFQQRTLPFWLMQPASRRRLWNEKMLVMLLATTSAALVGWLGAFAIVWPHVDITYKVAALVSVMATAASAPFWTLATGSSLGGFVLVWTHLSGVFWIAKHFSDIDESADSLNQALPGQVFLAIVVCGIVYSAVMIWLGSWKLARLKLPAAYDGPDLPVSGSTVMPERLAAWFSCHRSEPFLNLLRRELLLLRSFWLSAAIVVLYLGFAVTFHLNAAFPIPIPSHNQRGPSMMLQWVAFGTLGAFFILLPIFAGLLSLGDERSSGTHAWQITMPVSPRRQWLMKLAMAVTAGLASSVVLPLAVVVTVGAMAGTPLIFVNVAELQDWIRLVPVMTFAAFWCACAANGTVRATVWVAIAPAVIFACGSAGMHWGQQLAATGGTLSDIIAAHWHLSPLASASITSLARGGVVWLFIPTLLVALVQSYRLFRAQAPDSAVAVARSLAPLAIVTVLWNASMSAGFMSSKWAPFDETRHAMDRLGRETLELSGDDLARSSTLSPLTRDWLAGSNITVVRDPDQSSGYLATIHLVGGRDCSLKVTHYGGTVARCGK